MKSAAHDFPARARAALNIPELARAMKRARTGFIDRRLAAVEGLPEYASVRRTAREIKEHTLQHLDYYLERFEERVREHGGHVHWASTPAEARAIVIDICRAAGAKRVTKGKSDGGRGGRAQRCAGGGGVRADRDRSGRVHHPARERAAEPHHRPRDPQDQGQISDLFHAHHAKYGLTERQTEPTALVGEARAVLREQFQSADVGITGANFLVAETGSSVIVTNEGNGDLTNTLPRVHVVTAGIEKVVPTLDDMSTILRVLARSATGQESAVYTTLSSGPRRAADLDGPGEYHVVLLDNGRSQMLGNEFHEMLRCIRCGACMNHCPVYHAVGGHAYGWVYVGPMGSVLTPLMVGLDEARDLPNACTLNGAARKCVRWRFRFRDMIRKLREREFDESDHAAAGPPRPARMGVRGTAPGAVSPGDVVGGCAYSASSGATAGASAGCRSRGAGPQAETCRRRRGATFHVGRGRSGGREEGGERRLHPAGCSSLAGRPRTDGFPPARQWPGWGPGRRSLTGGIPRVVPNTADEEGGQ